MTNIRSTKSDANTIVQDLHQVRESIVDSFGGDLHKLAADARERQTRSGKVIWQGKTSNQRMDRTAACGSSEVETSDVRRRPS